MSERFVVFYDYKNNVFLEGVPAIPKERENLYPFAFKDYYDNNNPLGFNCFGCDIKGYIHDRNAPSAPSQYTAYYNLVSVDNVSNSYSLGDFDMAIWSKLLKGQTVSFKKIAFKLSYKGGYQTLTLKRNDTKKSFYYNYDDIRDLYFEMKPKELIAFIDEEFANES